MKEGLSDEDPSKETVCVGGSACCGGHAAAVLQRCRHRGIRARVAGRRAPVELTYSIDVKSIRKDETTGIISFHYFKQYRDEDVHDGEICSIEGRLDYDPAKQEYAYRSMNFERKNKPALADVLVFAVPKWQEIEARSPEDIMCREARLHLEEY